MKGHSRWTLLLLGFPPPDGLPRLRNGVVDCAPAPVLFSFLVLAGVAALPVDVRVRGFGGALVTRFFLGGIFVDGDLF